RDQNTLPRQVARDCGDARVNRSRCVAARKCDPEFAALPQRFVGLIDNEVGGVSDKIFRAKNDAAHARARLNRTVRSSALFQITLMIFFRAPESRRRLDLCHDRTLKLPTLLRLL